MRIIGCFRQQERGTDDKFLVVVSGTSFVDMVEELLKQTPPGCRLTEVAVVERSASAAGGS